MKKNLLRIILALLIVVIPLSNWMQLYVFSDDKAITADNKEYSFPVSAYGVNEVVSYISNLFAQREKEREEERLQLEREKSLELFISDIKSGKLAYRKVFSDILIVGDSLMQGLNTYRVLDSSNMISMVSASLYHLEGNVEKIIANNPEKLVTHYGINMLVNSDSYLNSFIEQYKRIIVRIKKALPDTEIYISGIFNVSSSVERSYPCVALYNEHLELMCDELGVEYIDNSACLPGDGKYYGSDGIHVSKGFYTDVWLPHLYYELYLR